ncbi:MAG TPA: MFS transporter [Anaerolineaceae bacterium]
MKKTLSWFEIVTVNSYYLGLNIASGIITPLLLPYMVLLFIPSDQKSTAMSVIRSSGLAVAMLVQPLAGLLSDRNTSRWGKRRPFIFWGAILNVLFLLIIAFSTRVPGTFAGFPLGYWIFFGGMILFQISSNIGHGALHGLIPDRVPLHQRGIASGIKSIMELLPVFMIIVAGFFVDRGNIWLPTGIIMLGFLATMGITIRFVSEEPLKEQPPESLREPILRIIALTAIFVGVSQGATWLVRQTHHWISHINLTLSARVLIVTITGLIAMNAAIFVGVFMGVRVGLGKQSLKYGDFIWWIINRLLYLAAISSIQVFTLFYLRDVLHIPKPTGMTTTLLATIAAFLLPAALIGGRMADKVGAHILIRFAGYIAAVGVCALILAKGVWMVLIGGSILGVSAGLFLATNWALGTRLVPPEEAGKYLGISNLAGAGAGIVGAGIGGPIADSLNRLQPGLGYLVIFMIYLMLFIISALVIRLIKANPANRIVVVSALTQDERAQP